MIKIIINGANGKMGKTAVAAIAQESDLSLVGTTSRGDDLSTLIKKTAADVVIDLTTPDAVFENVVNIIEAGARPVIGTTGLSLSQIETLTTLCKEKKCGAIIAPNFSLAAILMMKFARETARYFPHAEIIEYHHPQKKDKPSGTALKTMQLMKEVTTQDIPIHSVRLPGVFAHQEVIFGGQGETFTLQHQAHDRNAMMPGLFLCCREIMKLNHLVYGMENFI